MKKETIISKRNGTIELIRFLGILLIMAHHIYHMGFEDYHFQNAWVYVEMFFIITGYYTTKHFAFSGSEKNISNSVTYTIKKFSKFAPYVIAGVLAEYICIFIQGKGNFSLIRILISKFPFDSSLLKILPFEIKLLNKLPFEIGLLSSSGKEMPEFLPIWFLSAMFIVFPIFCSVVQLKHKDAVFYCSWIVPIIYYGAVGVSCTKDWPHDMLRAFSCMLIGTFVFFVSERMKNFRFTNAAKVIFNIIKYMALILPIILTFFNWYAMELILLCFIVYFIIVFSSDSSFGSNSAFIGFLGKISMPMYLIHWPLGSVINIYLSGLSAAAKLSVYYIGTIVLSCIFYFIVEKAKGKFIFRKDYWIIEQ